MLDLLTLLLSLLSLLLGLLVLFFGLLFGLLHLLQGLQLLLLRLIIVVVDREAAVTDQIRWGLRVLSARIRQPHGTGTKGRFFVELPSVQPCKHGDGCHAGENQLDRWCMPAACVGWMGLMVIGTGCAHTSGLRVVASYRLGRG